ncbi:MAG TPA: glycosyltransferase family 2 protein [Pyrinomonadaceae bacterium]|nr:glycosyltransferase family 2 protein [Pyrinomonadaceae bacterium]
MSLAVQIAWLILFAWLFGAAATLFVLATLRHLRPTKEAGLKGDDAPLVSVLVPARDEADRILDACVRSILAQDYGRFEVVAVDDRSTDATPLILKRLADEDARLRVLSGAETPPGWLGKPHALQQALAASRGVWVLTTDADVILHPSALRTAVAYARRHEADAVTFVPLYEAETFWERVFVPTWGWAMLLYFPPLLMNLKAYPFALGLGGFFLVRREALARVEGFARVRGEVVEDMRLAEQLRRAGARLRVEHAPELLRTRMYTSLRELWQSAARVWFASTRFSLALSAFVVVWMFVMGILPTLLAVVSAAMLAAGGDGVWAQLLAPASVAWALHVASLAAVSRRLGVPARYALTVPVGWMLNCAVLVSSAASIKTGRGVRWRGREVYGQGGGVRPPRMFG